MLDEAVDIKISRSQSQKVQLISCPHLTVSVYNNDILRPDSWNSDKMKIFVLDKKCKTQLYVKLQLLNFFLLVLSFNMEFFTSYLDAIEAIVFLVLRRNYADTMNF